MPNLDTEIVGLIAALDRAQEALLALRLQRTDTRGFRTILIQDIRKRRLELNAWLTTVTAGPPKEK